jgi:hypothetical protein
MRRTSNPSVCTHPATEPSQRTQTVVDPMPLHWLRQVAETVMGAVQQEYPNDLRHPMTGPDDRPVPHQIHPSFYGCYDWQSAVELIPEGR